MCLNEGSEMRFFPNNCKSSVVLLHTNILLFSVSAVASVYCAQYANVVYVKLPGWHFLKCAVYNRAHCIKILLPFNFKCDKFTASKYSWIISAERQLFTHFLPMRNHYYRNHNNWILHTWSGMRWYSLLCIKTFISAYSSALPQI